MPQDAASTPAPDLASRYVDVASIPWSPTRWPGVVAKTLMEDKTTGMATLLMR